MKEKGAAGDIRTILGGGMWPRSYQGNSPEKLGITLLEQKNNYNKVLWNSILVYVK